MKKILPILLLIVLLVSCSQTNVEKETRVFTDSAGREVTLSSSIEKICPAGKPSQIILYTIAPEKMVGWAKKPNESESQFMLENVRDLPEFGSFYGKTSDINLEEVIQANPDVIIDIGEKKDGIVEDMDSIQEKTGIPTVFIEGEFETMEEAYRMLGDLLDKQEQASELAEYCKNTMTMAKENQAKLPKIYSVYYGTGDNGLQANADGSIHASVLEAVGLQNVAKIDKTGGAGGNEISMETLYNWNPEIILFDPGSKPEDFGTNSVWKDVKATTYTVPSGPYNFLGRPPSINRYLGIKWLGQTLYPDVYQLDLNQEIKDFYQLFYHYEISDEQIQEILAQ